MESKLTVMKLVSVGFVALKKKHNNIVLNFVYECALRKRGGGVSFDDNNENIHINIESIRNDKRDQKKKTINKFFTPFFVHFEDEKGRARQVPKK